MWHEDLIQEAATLLQTHPDAGTARAYLESRGVSLDEAALHSVGVLCPIRQGSKTFLQWARRYWVPWGGLVFPLRDSLGGLMGIEIRRLPSEVEPGQQPYADFQFTRTGQPLAFGLSQALPHVWRTERVLLVEGVFDYFALRAAGGQGVVANLTAAVAGPMRRWLGRYAKVVVAFLDMDPAGRAAVQRLIDIGTQEGFLVVVPSYPAKDAGTMLQDGRIEQLRGLVSRFTC